MSVNLTINGVGYAFPQTGESFWGDVVTQWATAVSSGLLQKNGGSFILTNELDFGASNGLKVLALTSQSANPASAGFLRLANTQTISWRNAANTGDMTLQVNASDQLEFSGVIANIFDNPMTTNGDMIIESSGATRLPVGIEGQVLKVTAGAPVWGTVAGSGDVLGPVSSVDNTLPRFNSTTGKVLQGSSVVVDDSNNMSGVSGFEQDLLPATNQTYTLGNGSFQWTRLQLGNATDKGQIWFNASAYKIVCDSSNNLNFSVGFNKVNIASPFEVDGASTFNNIVDIVGAATVTGAFGVTGDTAITGDLTVTGNAPGKFKRFVQKDFDFSSTEIHWYYHEIGDDVSTVEATVVGSGGGSGGTDATTAGQSACGSGGGAGGVCIKTMVRADFEHPELNIDSSDIDDVTNRFNEGHDYPHGLPVQLTTTGTLPGGLSLSTTYYVKNNAVTGSFFQLMATQDGTGSENVGGSAIDLTTQGTGVHTVVPQTAFVSGYVGIGGFRGSSGTAYNGVAGQAGTLVYSPVAEIIAGRGLGGGSGNATSGVSLIEGGSGGTATGGDQNFLGAVGGAGGVFAGYPVKSNFGGGNHLVPPTSSPAGYTDNGRDGNFPGGGAVGATARNASGSRDGGTGGDGVVFLKEYY